MYLSKIGEPQGLAKKYPPLRMLRRTRPYFRRGPHHRWGRRSKVLLFLHTCKKKVQFVEKPALFYLEVGRFIYHLCRRQKVHLSSIIYHLCGSPHLVHLSSIIYSSMPSGKKFIYSVLVIRWLFVRYTLVISLRPS